MSCTVVAEISREKSTVVSVFISPFASESRQEGEQRGSDWCGVGQRGFPVPGPTESYQHYGEPPIATAFGFCLSQHLYLTSANTSVTTSPTEPSAKFLPLPRDSELRSEQEMGNDGLNRGRELCLFSYLSIVQKRG